LYNKARKEVLRQIKKTGKMPKAVNYWEVPRLKTWKLKNVWKRWYFANLVRKSFIRRVNIGIVCVIKGLIDVQILNVKL
jgi:hypothetical protein